MSQKEIKSRRLAIVNDAPISPTTDELIDRLIRMVEENNDLIKSEIKLTKNALKKI